MPTFMISTHILLTKANSLWLIYAFFILLCLPLSGCYVSETSILNAKNSDKVPFTPLRCGTVNDLKDQKFGQIFRITKSTASTKETGHLYELINDEVDEQKQKPINIRFKFLGQGRYLLESPMHYMGEKTNANIYFLLEDQEYGLDIMQVNPESVISLGKKRRVKLGKTPDRWILEGNAKDMLAFFNDQGNIHAEQWGICKRLD
ncbi:MAG: hypothetical protein RNU03_20815 [Candidatus Sedimenticola sp. (ex Thyasira tokunagai)]